MTIDTKTQTLADITTALMGVVRKNPNCIVWKNLGRRRGTSQFIKLGFHKYVKFDNYGNGSDIRIDGQSLGKDNSENLWNALENAKVIAILNKITKL